MCSWHKSNHTSSSIVQRSTVYILCSGVHTSLMLTLSLIMLYVTAWGASFFFCFSETATILSLFLHTHTYISCVINTLSLIADLEYVCKVNRTPADRVDVMSREVEAGGGRSDPDANRLIMMRAWSLKLGFLLSVFTVELKTGINPCNKNAIFCLQVEVRLFLLSKGNFDM